MSLLDKNLDITPQDIIKNRVVKILARENLNNIEVVWESCDWPRPACRTARSSYPRQQGNRSVPL